MAEEDGPLEEVSSPPSEKQEAPAKAWGWGSWLSDLQKAAADAAEEITKNATQAMAELQSTVTDKKAADEAAGDAEAEKEEDHPSEKLREDALRKLEGASKDSTLSHGLKMLDDSVDSLAAGAFQALGTAWKGSLGLVHRLETQAEQLAGSIQSDTLTAKAGTLAPKLLQSGKDLTMKGLKALEYVGKETIDILSLDELERNLNSRDEAENVLEDATFDRCFYIYGGPEHLEELETLSNHYMLLCNRAKGKLTGDQRAMFDGILKHLPQMLTLGNDDGSPESDKGKQIDKAPLDDKKELKQLRESSVSKAAEMATSFTATLGGLAMSEVVQKTTDRLEAIKSEGVHRLSELCAICVSHLLVLARSVVTKGSEDAPEDMFTWPEDCLGKAALIRGRAKDMAGDIEAVSDSFTTGIGDVTAAFHAAMKEAKGGEQAPPREISIVDKAHSLSNELQSDGSAAVEKLQEGLQHLVYIVLSTSLKN